MREKERKRDKIFLTMRETERERENFEHEPMRDERDRERERGIFELGNIFSKRFTL